MPSSSSGGTLGKFKCGDETLHQLTRDGRSGGNNSLRDIQNGSMSQNMSGSGTYDLQDQMLILDKERQVHQNETE